jgi:hypothetical protein
LLAGFSFALIGLIVPDASKYRMADTGLSLIAGAAIAFIASVQCAFWARQYAVTPTDLEAWYPVGEVSREERVGRQKQHRLAFLRWNHRANQSYRIGLLLLLSGTAVVLVPPGSVEAGRLTAIAIVGAGFVGELLWIFSTWLLAGSGTLLFNDTADEPTQPVRLERIRRAKPLRRLARFFIPVFRVQTPQQGRHPGGTQSS